MPYKGPESRTKTEHALTLAGDVVYSHACLICAADCLIVAAEKAVEYPGVIAGRPGIEGACSPSARPVCVGPKAESSFLLGNSKPNCSSARRERYLEAATIATDSPVCRELIITYAKGEKETERSQTYPGQVGATDQLQKRCRLKRRELQPFERQLSKQTAETATNFLR